MAAPEPGNSILENNAEGGPDFDHLGHPKAGAPDSGPYGPDDSQIQQDHDIENAVVPLPTAEPSPPSRPRPAALLPPELILKVLDTIDLDVLDLLCLEQAGIAPVWSFYAREAALRKLAFSEIKLATIVYGDHWEEVTKIERLFAVIRNRPREKWVLPDDRIVFEPNYDVLRPRYHRHHYRPADVELVGLPGTPVPKMWRLIPHRRLSHRDEDSRGRVYLPHTNCTRLREDRYSVFEYFHDRDPRKEVPTKVWYKFDGDMMQLHCISIPLHSLVNILRDDF
jgi:hypothetical protein